LAIGLWNIASLQPDIGELLAGVPEATALEHIQEFYRGASRSLAASSDIPDR
jgi:hypothetical protein